MENTAYDSPKCSLQDELILLQKEHSSSRRREDALKAALEKSEAQVKTLNDKGIKYIALQSKVETLEKVHADGKKRHSAELEALKNQLNQGKKLNADQKAKIERLTSQSDSSATVIKGLKLSIKHAQSDAEELRIQLKSVEKERASALTKVAEFGQAETRRRADDRARNSKISELEKQLSEALASNKATDARCKELEAKLKIASQESDANTVKLRIIQSDANRRVLDTKELQRQAVDSESQRRILELNLQSRDEQLAEVKNMLATAAQAYGQLYSSTVQSSLLNEAKQEARQLRYDTIRLQRKLADREAQVRELADLIRQYSNEKRSLAAAVTETNRDSEDRFEQYQVALKGLQDSMVLQKEREEIQSMVAELDSIRGEARLSTDQDQRYCHLLTDYYCEELQAIQRCYRSLNIRHEETLVALKVLETTTTNFQAIRVELLQECEQLRASVAQTAEVLKSRERELEESRRTSEALRVKLDAVEDQLRKDVQKAETALAEELERMKDMKNALMQSQAREQGYKDDINVLVEQVEDLGRYEKAYHDMIREVNKLVSRNALAEHEADHLSQINAEILSHTNPNQKIFYVDKIRRELAETKQNLIEVNCELKEALHFTATLTAELASYKSISLPVDSKPGTKLTRVQRVPLGDRNAAISHRTAPGMATSAKDELREQPMTLEELA